MTFFRKRSHQGDLRTKFASLCSSPANEATDLCLEEFSLKHNCSCKLSASPGVSLCGTIFPSGSIVLRRAT